MKKIFFENSERMKRKNAFFSNSRKKFFAEGYQNTGILYLKKYMGEEEQSEKDEKFLL